MTGNGVEDVKVMKWDDRLALDSVLYVNDAGVCLIYSNNILLFNRESIAIHGV